MFRILLVLTIILLFPVFATSTPTKTHKQLYWDNYTDPKGIGFFLYYAPEAENPRDYNDTRKVDVGFPSPIDVLGDGILRHSLVVIDVHPGAKASLCFKLTVYDINEQESDFGNEACGWLGLPAPSGTGLK